MLELKGIGKTFNAGTVNEKVALKGVDLTLNDGDFVTVIGGNGAGKSTLLNAIAGVWRLDCGSVVLDGHDLTNMPEYMRAKFLGRVFQDPMMGTAADMQIDENLAIAKMRGRRHTLGWGVKKADREEFVELLRMLGLGLDTDLLKLLSAVVVALFLAIPYIKKEYFSRSPKKLLSKNSLEKGGDNHA